MQLPSLVNFSNMVYQITRLIRKNFELVFWCSSLLYLSWTDPTATHFDLCLLKHLGIAFCPGCGLGHSIAHLLNGEVIASFQAHWLGIPAFVIILHRIYQLIEFKNYGKASNEKADAVIFSDCTGGRARHS